MSTTNTSTEDNSKSKNLAQEISDISKDSTPSSSSSSTLLTSHDGPYSTQHINSSMSTKEAYFELLRIWVNQANISQTAMACFPYYLMANYPQIFQQQQIGQNVIAGSPGGMRNMFGIGPNIVGARGGGGGFAGFGGVNGLRERRFGDYFDNEMRQAQEELINQNGGYEFVIAPFWKRVVAEIIDSLILLLLKLVLTFTVVDLFDLNLYVPKSYEANYKHGVAFNLDNLKKSIEDDYAEFISFSSDLLLIEILTKVLVCFYEALWTTSGHIYVGGATPGKILMGIRIVYAEAVVPLPPPQQQQQQQQPGIFLNNNNNNGQLRALLYPASNPGFKRALLRAMAKNILMALLFPMCFIMLFFKNNRTGYDVMTKTIVVEENPAPLLRRRVQ